MTRPCLSISYREKTAETYSRLPIVLLGALLLFILTAPSAQAEPNIVIKYQYYDLQGNNVRELWQGIKKFGIWENNGKDNYAGQNNWHITWRYNCQTNDQGRQVSLVSLTTNLEITFIMPRWENRTGASSETVSKWNNYIPRLQYHEDGHKSFAVAAAYEFEEAVSQLKTYPSCPELGAAINDIYLKIEERYKAKNIAYDQQTRHGLTQGANLR